MKGPGAHVTLYRCLSQVKSIKLVHIETFVLNQKVENLHRKLPSLALKRCVAYICIGAMFTSVYILSKANEGSALITQSLNLMWQ